MPDWYIYIVKCSDESLYTGITRDVERRVEEHNSNDLLGARYTRSRRPVTLVYEESAGSRSEATKREAAIKKLGKNEKKDLISEKTAGRQ
ncbi:MAG: GIY-YIG nuclease family protein [bacterium]|nr:GIY-YIG nuclease family protein [bacterium]